MPDIDRHLPKLTDELDELDDDDWFFLVTARDPEDEDTDWRVMSYTGRSEKLKAHVNLAGSHLEYINRITDNSMSHDMIAQFALEAALLHLRQNQMWTYPDEDEA